jgi:hypothetical protein
MNFIIKKASSLTEEEQTSRGIKGIPQDWPIEKYIYIDTIPDGFELISEEDLETLVYNNQAAYDAWLNALRPLPPTPPPTEVSVVSQPNIIIASTPPFGAKTLNINGVTKRLFARFTGFQQSLDQGTNTITYTINYPWVKILGVEVINSESLDYVNFKVYDNAQGSYSGVPNLMLNQFAYTLNLAKDYYMRMAQFDADAYAGMVVEITYYSVSQKTVAFNLLMNEVKT